MVFMMNELTTKFTVNDVEIINRDITYQGIFQISQVNLRHRLHAGGWSPVFLRELFQRGSAVGILPYDPILDEIVLLEQFRIGAMEDERSPWLFEVAAGMIDEGETPKQTAIRELKEETGLNCMDLLPIITYWVSPGGSDEKITLYCARVDASQADGLHGMADEHEEIRVHRCARSQVVAMMAAGQLKNAPTLIACQWLELNLEQVRAAWE